MAYLILFAGVPGVGGGLGEMEGLRCARLGRQWKEGGEQS